MTDYDGKKIVITGGTTGIGLATARYFQDRGARLLVTGHSENGLISAKSELGDRALVLNSDAMSLHDIEELAERVKDEFAPFDLLFLNAGISRFLPFEATSEEVYDSVFAVNVKGPYFTAQKLAPLLSDGGAIVLTTSVVNVKGLPNLSAFSASKAALRSLARTLARELLPRQIRVNAVTPGPIESGILERTLGKEGARHAAAQMRGNNPMGRFGDPEEVARAVAFLAFEATFTTGAEIPVDGGASQLN
jgi:NAD(P)-dependent dehydrogenase (short-subunit alcohol dehydrogenase family)